MLKKYKYEFITAAVCGVISLVMLIPLVPGGAARWWPFGETESRGPVVIYRTVTGDPLMSGNTTREAVENGLKRVREGVAAVSEQDAPAANFTALSPEIVDESPETVGRMYRLVKTFYGADLRDTALQGMDFRGINLQHADFTNTDLSGAQFDGALLSGASFVHADLSAATFGKRPENVPQEQWPAGGNATGARFLNCNFEGETLSGRLSGANFGSANLRGATLRVWQCEQVDLSSANLTDGAIEFWPDAVPGPSPDWDPQAFYRTVIHDEKTMVRGLRLTGVTDTTIPFVQWALEHGAVLADPEPVPEVAPAAVQDTLPEAPPS